ncbi:MAG TPA: aminopeptidase [Candidatus Eisenbacteria bacterium]|nr:aminopeptidase [Candidatus Eisenbacteria bacterium]
MTKKTKAEELKKNLFQKKINCWDSADESTQTAVHNFSKEYKNALNQGKTERRFITYSINRLKKAGFKDVSEYKRLKEGDKVYLSMREKTLVAAVIGKEEPAKGFNIVGSHVDSPRLDLKPNPLFEDEELVYFKTHYYGGIKKYQWLATALSIHGVVYLEDGSKVDINIGDHPDDPVFTVTDLLPHLDKHLRSKKASEFVDGEKMNLLVGSIPYPDKNVEERFKLGLLVLLNEEYGIKEADFNRAEIEVVPSQMARDVGFDRSMIGAYGQDDRVCAYTSLQALIDSKAANKTMAILFTDKEEVGSDGNTGAQSNAFQYKLNLLHELILGKEPSRREIEDFYLNTNLLSSDVSHVFDPNFSEVSDPLNSAYLSKGITINKYTGSGGKYSTNDANAEFVSYVLNIFEKNKIPYQIAELGKVDWGGGGTIAKFFAKTGMNVIDSGVSMFAMHSCFEITSKIDVYNTYRAYIAFLKGE